MGKQTHELVLKHFTHQPLLELRAVVQPKKYSDYIKPKGLWVSVEGTDDWPTWCQANNFPIGTLEYEIHLKRGANILYINTQDKLDDFSREHAIVPPFPGAESLGHKNIDWAPIAEKFQGIIIAPYQWGRRMSAHTFWYYGWDCASGCIWDVDAIESVELVKSPVSGGGSK